VCCTASQKFPENALELGEVPPSVGYYIAEVRLWYHESSSIRRNFSVQPTSTKTAPIMLSFSPFRHRGFQKQFYSTVLLQDFQANPAHL